MSGSETKRGERKGSRTSLSKKAIKATKAVRIPQEGCQVSLQVDFPRASAMRLKSPGSRSLNCRAVCETHGWKLEMERQIFLLTSNRPDGVSM